jgi:hypothetical protein
MKERSKPGVHAGSADHSQTLTVRCNSQSLVATESRTKEDSGPRVARRGVTGADEVPRRQPPVTPWGGAGLTRWSDKRLRQDARPSRAEAELAARPNETSRTTAAFDDESVSAETRCPAHGIRAA